MGNTLGNRIVGKPIEQPSPHSNTESAYKELDSQMTRLEKRITHITTLLNHTRTQAQEAAKQGDKAKAMRLLSRVKDHETNVQSHQAMLNRLIQQRDLLEKTQFQTDTLRTMGHVNQHLKQSKPVTVEDAEAIIEEITELKQTTDDVMNILATPITDTVSQEELEHDYQVMVAAATTAQQPPQPILLPKPPMPPMQLPEAPLPPSGFPVAKRTMLDELETV